MNLSIYIHTECGRNFPSHSPVSAVADGLCLWFVY